MGANHASTTSGSTGGFARSVGSASLASTTAASSEAESGSSDGEALRQRGAGGGQLGRRRNALAGGVDGLDLLDPKIEAEGPGDDAEADAGHGVFRSGRSTRESVGCQGAGDG
jgi:hypothetical protein